MNLCSGLYGRKTLYLAFLLLFFSACSKKDEAPNPDKTKEILSSRTLGLAFLEENRLEEAETAFLKLIELAPKEAGAHANLSLAYLRLGRTEEALERIEVARTLSPDDPDINMLYAEILDLAMQGEKAREALRSSLTRHPDHPRMLFALAQYILNSQAADRHIQAEPVLARLVAAKPANIVARLGLTEVLLHNAKADSALGHLEALKRIFPDLPKEAMPYYKKAVDALQAGNAADAVTPSIIVHNYVKGTAFYQGDMRELKGQAASQAGSPVLTLSNDIMLQATGGQAAIEAMRFVDATATSGLLVLEGSKNFVFDVSDFNGDGHQDLYIGATSPDGKNQHYLMKNDIGLFEDVAASAGIAHQGRDLAAQFVDADNNGFLDIFVAGEDKNQLYMNVSEGRFEDKAVAAGIAEPAASPVPVFADFDHDGDLDLFLGTARKNRLYRNNLDGSFTEHAAKMQMAGTDAASAAHFADFDEDGDLDLLVANANAQSALYSNLRIGRFEEIAARVGLAQPGTVKAQAVGDYNNDGFQDIAVSAPNGGISLFRNKSDGSFEIDIQPAIARLTASRSFNNMTFFDFDNDGFLDLLLAGAPVQKNGKRGVFLLHNDGTGSFKDRSDLLPAELKRADRIALIDYNEDGDLDFIISDLDKGLRLIRNDGGNINKYLKIKLVGIRSGSGKNNHFGIGAKVEMRAGDLYQTRVITSAATHMGLGQRLKADVIRILWPNGAPQNLFYPGSDQDIIEEQTLKGSCPLVYTWNGSEFSFHTDIMWKSALGMPLGIMGGEEAWAPPHSSDEYALIPGEKMQQKDGAYLLQITEELWETIYIDKVRLVAVDHPKSVDIFLDQRFAPPFSQGEIFQAGEKRLPVKATDDSGNDLLETVSRRDGKYVTTFESDTYQGVTTMHSLMLDLGEIPTDSQVQLFLNGWIFPSDASINVAIRQAKNMKVVPPSIQLRNADGDWQTVIPDFGFPMGKDKIVVADLTGKLLTPHVEVRIPTNMQIYWDAAFFTVGATREELRKTELTANAADLHFRGFSRTYRKGGRYGPHWFDYNQVTTAPKWRDLTGYYTRYGDILELLAASDDRYAIMNAGDEISLSFDAKQLPPLPDGWKRDFLLYSDGWIKDGDLNTAHGNTVGPLPFHALKTYPYGPDERYPTRRLEAYNKKYNTRYVGPGTFQNLVRDNGHNLQPNPVK